MTPVLVNWKKARRHMETQTFKYDPSRFDEVKKALIKKWVPILIVAFGVGLYISVVNKKTSAEFLFATAPFTIIFAFIIVSIRSLSIIRRRKEQYESFRLVIDEGAISREQINTPTIRILKIDILRIDKNRTGRFTIRGKNYSDVIYVAEQIENYNELKGILQQIKPFNV